MIRFAITKDELYERIDEEVASWRKRAAERQKEINKKKRVDEDDGIWSEIKRVFMELQGWKCMYCEKPMPKPDPNSKEGTAEGKVEYDVEHYRPKNSVKAWPTAKIKKLRMVDYDDQLHEPPAGGGGYYKLALDPLNYGVSCKTCNSELKGDRFPTLRSHNRALTDRTKLDEKEEPCLVLPIGEVSPDPEEILEWLGPVVRSRNDEIRGRAIVDFFQLDTRADLVEGRAALIGLLYPKLEDALGTGQTAKTAQEFVDAMTADTSTWAACARAYVKLHGDDRAEAKRWNDLCVTYLIRRDPRVFK